MTSRLDLATENSRLVVDVDGLLAVFNDAGVLDPLDVKVQPVFHPMQKIYQVY